MKKLLKKLGIDLDKKNTCIKCKKLIPADKKRCPFCEAWNDCCSIDPKLLGKTDEDFEKENKK